METARRRRGILCETYTGAAVIMQLLPALRSGAIRRHLEELYKDFEERYQKKYKEHVSTLFGQAQAKIEGEAVAYDSAVENCNTLVRCPTTWVEFRIPEVLKENYEEFHKEQIRKFKEVYPDYDE